MRNCLRTGRRWPTRVPSKNRSSRLKAITLVWVTEARALPAYRLWVRFSDGTAGVVDLSELIASDPRPIVRDLRDPTAFAAIRVEMDTVVWENGFDLAPEFLREHARPGVPA